MRFVDEHSGRFAVALLLRVLGIGESTYYAWKQRAGESCDRDLVDLGLISNIHEIWGGIWLHLRRGPGPPATTPRWHPRRAQTRRAADGRPGLAGRLLAPGRARWLYETEPAGDAGAGPGQPRLHCGRPEPVVGRRRYPHPVRRRGVLAGRRAG